MVPKSLLGRKWKTEDEKEKNRKQLALSFWGILAMEEVGGIVERVRKVE